MMSVIFAFFLGRGKVVAGAAQEQPEKKQK
jgi:hypothetical protein